MATGGSVARILPTLLILAQPGFATEHLYRDPVTGTVVEWRGTDLDGRCGATDHLQRALTFIDAHHRTFLLRHPRRELALSRQSRDDLGHTRLRFAQTYRHLPVWGAELSVHFDAQDCLIRLAGRYAPTPRNLGLEPAIDAATARRVAGCGAARACQETLVVYPAKGGAAHLVYQVEVTASLASRQVLVDAVSGGVVVTIPRVYDGAGSPTPGPIPVPPPPAKFP
ncbi:MAG: hypothetical protein ACFCBW_15780 [Candidatus Competibacterales bacterium]